MKHYSKKKKKQILKKNKFFKYQTDSTRFGNVISITLFITQQFYTTPAGHFNSGWNFICLLQQEEIKLCAGKQLTDPGLQEWLSPHRIFSFIMLERKAKVTTQTAFYFLWEWMLQLWNMLESLPFRTYRTLSQTEKANY